MTENKAGQGQGTRCCGRLRGRSSKAEDVEKMTGQESAFKLFYREFIIHWQTSCDNEGIADGSDVPWTYPQHTRELENPESTVPCPRLTRHPSLFNLFLAWLRPERPIPSFRLLVRSARFFGLCPRSISSSWVQAVVLTKLTCLGMSTSPAGFFQCPRPLLTRPSSRPRRYLVKPCNKSWDDGIVALEAGTSTSRCTTRVRTCADRDSLRLKGPGLVRSSIS